MNPNHININSAKQLNWDLETINCLSNFTTAISYHLKKVG